MTYLHFWPLHSGYPCTTFSNYSTEHEQFDGYWEPLWSIHTADTKTDTDTDKMGTEPSGNLYWCLSLWATWNFHTTLDKSFLPFCVSGSVNTTFPGRPHYDYFICKEISECNNLTETFDQLYWTWKGGDKRKEWPQRKGSVGKTKLNLW